MTERKIFRAGYLACALGALLLASSCATPAAYKGLTADPDLNHPITVHPAYKSMNLSFATPATGLLPHQDARFGAFVRNYLTSGTGAISVSVPAGPASPQTIHYFGEKLADLGVPRSHILVGTRNAGQDNGVVELGYMTFKASTAPCRWQVDVGNSSPNLPTPNFGCATQHNLAAMVADPRDLVEPRALGPSDATRRAVVLGQYEQGKPTAATKTADQTTTISGLQ